MVIRDGCYDSRPFDPEKPTPGFASSTNENAFEGPTLSRAVFTPQTIEFSDAGPCAALSTPSHCNQIHPKEPKLWHKNRFPKLVTAVTCPCQGQGVSFRRRNAGWIFGSFPGQSVPGPVLDDREGIVAVNVAGQPRRYQTGGCDPPASGDSQGAWAATVPAIHNSAGRQPQVIQVVVCYVSQPSGYAPGKLVAVCQPQIC